MSTVNKIRHTAPSSQDTYQLQLTNKQLRPHVFNSASILSNAVLDVPVILREYMNNTIDHFETGTITLIESNQISPVHTELHTVMANATEVGWPIKLIDIANCFNPHLLSAITFNTNLSTHQVLCNISLARPFQLHQSVSIIRQLGREVGTITKSAANFSITPQLIVVTDISAQFFDSSLALEDKAFPIPQLELLRHILGILQGLAAQGHMIILTELTRRKDLLQDQTDKMNYRIQATSLAYVSNIHIRIETLRDERNVYLLTHPFFPPTMRSVKLQKKRSILNTKQLTLNDWY